MGRKNRSRLSVGDVTLDASVRDSRGSEMAVDCLTGPTSWRSRIGCSWDVVRVGPRTGPLGPLALLSRSTCGKKYGKTLVIGMIPVFQRGKQSKYSSPPINTRAFVPRVGRSRSVPRLAQPPDVGFPLLAVCD